MTKKEKLIKKIEDLAGKNDEINDSLTMKQLEGIYENLMAGPALDPPLPIELILKTPDIDVSTVNAIQDKMRIINAKLKSTDPKDVEEGQKDLKAFTERLKEVNVKTDLRQKFLGNV